MAVAADARELTEDESQFRIEATGALREPRTRILKHGETFGVLNQFGDMLGEPGSGLNQSTSQAARQEGGEGG